MEMSSGSKANVSEGHVILNNKGGKVSECKQDYIRSHSRMAKLLRRQDGKSECSSATTAMIMQALGSSTKK